MAKNPIRVAITGAAGQIAYSLIFRIAAGDVFGPDQPVALRLLEIEPALPKCHGVVMELEDCAFPLVTELTATSDPAVAFKDADWCLLVGSVPRKAGMERKDLLGINGKIFVGQGKSIAENASKGVRVLVVGNPCNTNALIAMRHAAGVPEENFFAMTRLDENRGKAQLAQKAGVHVSAVKNMTIWGNHSSTQFPDFTNATINGASSAASAANAAIETVRNLVNPTPAGDWFSVGVVSKGEYGTVPGIITGFPVRTKTDGSWEIVPNLPISDFARAKIDASIKELCEERDTASEALGCKL